MSHLDDFNERLHRWRFRRVTALPPAPGDFARARLNATALQTVHRHADSRLRTYTLTDRTVKDPQRRIATEIARETEARSRTFQRPRPVRRDGGQNPPGWHEVVRVKQTTVTVKTARSWKDTIRIEQVLEESW